MKYKIIFLLIASGLCSGWLTPFTVGYIPYSIGILPEGYLLDNNSHHNNHTAPPSSPFPHHDHPLVGTWELESILANDHTPHRDLAMTFGDIFEKHPMTIKVEEKNDTGTEDKTSHYTMTLDVLGARIDGLASVQVSCSTYYTIYLHSIRLVSPPWNIPFRRRALQDIMSLLPRIRRFQKTGIRLSFTFLPARKRILAHIQSSSLLFKKK